MELTEELKARAFRDSPEREAGDEKNQRCYYPEFYKARVFVHLSSISSQEYSHTIQCAEEDCSTSLATPFRIRVSAPARSYGLASVTPGVFITILIVRTN